MLVNEENIKEALRVLNMLKAGVLEGKEEDAQYAISPREELMVVTDILVILETNDRMSGNKPTAGQMGFALSLAKQNTDKAKTILKDMGKPTIDKLNATEISTFIDRMKGRD
jgi:hypothetical protein